MCCFSGLDSSILVYLQLFLNNEVNGQQLLNVRSEDLDNLGIKRLGHQELILEAVEHLRNFVSFFCFLFLVFALFLIKRQLILFVFLHSFFNFVFPSTMNWTGKIFNYLLLGCLAKPTVCIMNCLDKLILSQLALKH